MGDGFLGEGGTGHRMHQFCKQHLLSEPAGDGPADAVSGSEGLGKGITIQYPAFLVERLTGPVPVSAKIHFPVDIVFDQGDLMPRDELYQRGLVRVRHAAAEWIAESRYEYTGFSRKSGNCGFKLCRIDA